MTLLISTFLHLNFISRKGAKFQKGFLAFFAALRENENESDKVELCKRYIIRTTKMKSVFDCDILLEI